MSDSSLTSKFIPTVLPSPSQLFSFISKANVPPLVPIPAPALISPVGFSSTLISIIRKSLLEPFKTFDLTVLKIFLDFISKNNIFFEDKKILARLHPEEFYKRKIIKKLKDKNILLSKKNLLNDIEDSNYIFGGNSTSLIYAKKLNKIVVNCLSKNQILQKNYNILIKEFLINAN